VASFSRSAGRLLTILDIYICEAEANLALEFSHCSLQQSSQICPA
jgi:hypothetical protein